MRNSCTLQTTHPQPTIPRADWGGQPFAEGWVGVAARRSEVTPVLPKSPPRLRPQSGARAGRTPAPGIATRLTPRTIVQTQNLLSTSDRVSPGPCVGNPPALCAPPPLPRALNRGGAVRPQESQRNRVTPPR